LPALSLTRTFPWRPSIARSREGPERNLGETWMRFSAFGRRVGRSRVSRARVLLSVRRSTSIASTCQAREGNGADRRNPLAREPTDS
jgi:hypothetical protein